ncbi:hypothetical protein [Nesterenkonia pannonica]|nr:hypothetical protein [Nesterenkonia pannonica]
MPLYEFQCAYCGSSTRSTPWPRCPRNEPAPSAPNRRVASSPPPVSPA